MDKIIPILPCVNVKSQIEFYENIGFEVEKMQFRSNSYMIVKYSVFEIHFYVKASMVPAENDAMCFVQVDDIEEIYEVLTSNIKKNYGKVWRNKIPRISKIRELQDDWRFTLTDLSGNTFYIGMPKEKGSGTFFRDLDNSVYTEKFSILFDFVYSKEDINAAWKLLNKLEGIGDELGDLDQAKFLLLTYEIKALRCEDFSTEELEQLLRHNHQKKGWNLIENKLGEIIDNYKKY